nr:hypothetical protein [Tanacetum cinerariifolium]
MVKSTKHVDQCGMTNKAATARVQKQQVEKNQQKYVIPTGFKIHRRALLKGKKLHIVGFCWLLRWKFEVKNDGGGEDSGCENESESGQKMAGKVVATYSNVATWLWDSCQKFILHGCGLAGTNISFKLSMRNCFIQGSVVRYVQLPPDGVDIELLHDATRREARLNGFPMGEMLLRLYKALMNELVNDGIQLSKLEINTSFINGLPKKWLSFCQSLRNTNNVKDYELASLFDSPDDEEDTRSSHEYLNDLEEEYQARVLLAKSKRFFKKEEVSSDDNEMVKVKVLMVLVEENDAVSKEGARNGKWVKISMRKLHTLLEIEDNDDRKVCLDYLCIDLNYVEEQRSNLFEQITSQKKRILGVDQLTEDPPSSGLKDLVFVKSSAGDTKILPFESQRNTTDYSVAVTDSSAANYDSADKSSVCSILLPPLKKLDGAEPISGPNPIKSTLRSKSTFKAEALKDVIINEPSSAPAKERKINPRNPQHAFKKCKACGSPNHTTTDHYDIEWFKRGKALQPKKAEALKSTRAESSNANKSKTPTKSGCSRHMTGVKSYLHKCMEQLGPKVVFGDDSTCTTEGYGSIKCNGIVFTKFDEKKGSIFNSNKEIVMVAPRVRDVYVLDMTFSAQEPCFFAKASENLNWLWHKRLTHLNFKTINKLAKQNLIIGLPSLVYSKDKPCSSCEKGKHHTASFKTKQTSSIKKCLHLLHMDLFRPVTPSPIKHENYTFVIVDEYSSTLVNFCDEKRISQNFSSPYTPEQNGVAERKNKTLMEASRIILSGSVFSKQYWTEVVAKDTSAQNTTIPSLPLPVPSMVTPAPQDRWSQDKHIELVNIIGNPGARMLTRSTAKQLSVASAHECLFIDFLSEEEPKKVSRALKHPGWVDATQDELHEFARNKVWTLVPAPYGKTIIGSRWVFRNKRDETGIVIKNKARLVAQGYN